MGILSPSVALGPLGVPGGSSGKSLEGLWRIPGGSPCPSQGNPLGGILGGSLRKKPPHTKIRSFPEKVLVGEGGLSILVTNREGCC